MSGGFPARLSPANRGMLLVLGVVVMFTVMDAIAKYLSRYYPVSQILCLRFFFHTLLFLVFLAPRIGLLNLVVLVIAGQLLTSMMIDQFGLIQMAVRKVSAVRMAGALVVLTGVALTLFGDRVVAAMSR